MTPGVTPAGDQMPAGVKGTDVVARLRVVQIQGSPGEGLVEEPRPPAESARGLRPDPGLDGPGFDRMEGGNQDTEIERLAPQCEAEVRDDRILGGVPHRVELSGSRTVRFGSPGTRDDVALYGWPRNRQIEVAEEPGLADRFAGFVAHGSAVAKRLQGWRNHYNSGVSWQINAIIP